jgi:hypothetical protein
MNLAVMSIHGMGSQPKDFADSMHLELKKRYSGSSEVTFDTIYWADVLSGAEDKLWDRVKGTHDLDFTKLRRFVVNALGDSIAYQPLRNDADPNVKNVYRLIHERIGESLKTLAAKAGPKTPLVILAHSLGSVIISNYLWDLWKPSSSQDPPLATATPLERGETLAGLVTFGSPIALWSLRYANFGEPIPFPSPKLATHHPKIKGQWLNFFDEDDIFGYPLKGINAKYKAAVTEDVAISVGGLFTGWNPIAHNQYWTDDEFTKPVALLMNRIARDTQA